MRTKFYAARTMKNFVNIWHLFPKTKASWWTRFNERAGWHSFFSASTYYYSKVLSCIYDFTIL